jgi:hypothetical protein
MQQQVARCGYCGPMDGSANSNVGGAATNVPGHGAIDVVSGRIVVRRQQRCCRHHLAVLNVLFSALLVWLSAGMDATEALGFD